MARVSYRETAAALDAARTEILQGYEVSLREKGSPLLANALAWQQAQAQAQAIVTDIVDSLRGQLVDFGGRAELLSEQIGESRAAQNIHQNASLQAAGLLFREVLQVSAVLLRGTPHAGPAMEVISIALNDSLNARVREAAAAYASFLLNRVHLAQVEERRRIARDLHDRVGSGASVAYRRLELASVVCKDEPERWEAEAADVLDAVGTVLTGLRQLTADLRLVEPLESLELALRRFVDSVGADGARLTIRVSGDESWATPAVLDEVFLIVREATRNALRHNDIATVMVRVDIAPHELSARVYDNGYGFVADAVSGGSGLSTMAERAALIAGTLSVSSTPGAGTGVTLLVPLGGERR